MKRKQNRLPTRDGSSLLLFKPLGPDEAIWVALTLSLYLSIMASNQVSSGRFVLRQVVMRLKKDLEGLLDSIQWVNVARGRSFIRPSYLLDASPQVIQHVGSY